MSPQREVFTILNDAGAVLARQRKHKIFRFQDGHIWVVPSSPSDSRAWLNNLAGLRRRLGLRRPKCAHVIQLEQCVAHLEAVSFPMPPRKPSSK
jgi:hypothetical protein